MMVNIQNILVALATIRGAPLNVDANINFQCGMNCI